MTIADTHTDQQHPRRPLRLWPGVVIAAVLCVLRFVVPLFVTDSFAFAVISGLVGSLAIAAWWLFFSRAPWVERVGALVLMAAALAATPRIVHESIAGGMMGMLFFVYAVPLVSLAFVAWAAASRGLSTGLRRASMAAAILLGCGTMALVRTGGVIGAGGSDFRWRWTETAEDRLLAQDRDEPTAPAAVTTASAPAASASAPEATVPAAAAAAAPSAGGPTATAPASGAATAAVPAVGGATATVPERPAAARTGDAPPAPVAAGAAPASPSVSAGAAAPGARAGAAAASGPAPTPAADRVSLSAATTRVAEWPGFRGPDRDSVVHGVRIETDWSKSPPVELWRRRIGPGWSSFAVDGDRIYTQEQRGEDEIVSCYNRTSGEPVWRHRDPARFWESNGGAGPRATPTLSHGRVYTFGATGLVNALDARDGSVIWSRNAATDAGKKVPMWGFAGSPLVVGDTVIVATGGRLAAYDAATGTPRWLGPTGGWGYSSPQLATIDGVAQIVLLNGAGAIGVSPADGTLLWKHEWEGDGIVQPAFAAGGDVLIGTGSGMGGGNVGIGVRRVAVTHGAGGWTVAERWTSNGLKPYFNDFVVHKGHAFGFDGSILACIDLEDGKRKWKGGRYGHGQVMVLPDQDLLLVLSEEGELALLNATPDRFTELARIPALEGKTWNHPVLVGDTLLVRNGEEMVAFRLARAGS